MTQLMDRAIERLKGLPASLQDDVASRILSELDDDHEWDTKFAGSQGKLAHLASKAKADISANRVRKMGFDDL